MAIVNHQLFINNVHVTEQVRTLVSAKRRRTSVWLPIRPGEADLKGANRNARPEDRPTFAQQPGDPRLEDELAMRFNGPPLAGHFASRAR